MTYKQKDLKIALKCVTTSEKLGFNWKKISPTTTTIVTTMHIGIKKWDNYLRLWSSGNTNHSLKR